MKKWAFLAATIVLLMITVPVLAKSSGNSQGKDGGEGWVRYGDIRVYWELADCTGGGSVDGYQYWWGQDRNQNGIVGEGLVQVDYGRFGGWVEKDEGSGYVDFGCEVGLDYYTDKVVHLTEGWVPGVTVPGEVNRFVVKDNNGDGIYEGGHNTVLFWDGLTQQGNPPGPYNIQNKFKYTIDATGDDGQVVGGYYWQMQYMMIPDDAE